MLELALVALLTQATPTTPTPVARSSDRPRTLSDVARERKGKTKPQGGVSSVEIAGEVSEESGGSSGKAASKSKQVASLRILSSTNSGVSSRGVVMFQGSVQNVGEGAACRVRIAYALTDDQGKPLAAGSASLSRVENGATASFDGKVSVPPNTFNASNRVSSGNPNVKIRYLGQGSAEVTSADACR